LVYVNDTLFYSSKVEYIDEVIEKLQKRGMDLEVKGEVAGFLGVHRAKFVWKYNFINADRTD
jgi:hypothetical protein